MTVATVTLAVDSLLLKETHGTRIWDEAAGRKALTS
jgi:hypothetical protein